MKRALLTITNDNYLTFTTKLIKSMLNTNPKFSDEIIIMYSDDYTKLSKKSKKLLTKLYLNISFRNYKLLDEYRMIQDKLSDSLHNAERTRLFHTIWKFELFRDFKDYDEILFLDSDMIVYSSLDQLWWLSSIYKSSPLLMCTDEWVKDLDDFKVHSYDGTQYLNTGLFLIRPKLLNPTSYDNLIKLALNTPVEELPNNGIYSDQDIINLYLRSSGNKITILPKSYNLWSVDAFNILYSNNTNMKALSGRISIIHYITKPHTNSLLTKIDEYWDSI